MISTMALNQLTLFDWKDKSLKSSISNKQKAYRDVKNATSVFYF